jgi:group II intron reverse transcriptase/maturase
MKTNLTDLVTPDSLIQAVKDMRKNRKPGIDGVTRDQLKDELLKTDLAQDIINQLAEGYRPAPIDERQIPKANGDKRSIFIPTARDAVVQKALVSGLTSMTEARFLDCSYGFRPNRSVSGAVLHASQLMQSGYPVVLTVDFDSFFPNVNHELLRRYLREHYLLGEDVRNLINSFITAKIIGQKIRHKIGIPAGIPLAPILANIYLHPLDLELRKLGVPFVRYADDITLFFKSIEDCLLFHTKFWDESEQRFGVIVNRKKTEMYAEDVRPVLGFSLDRFGVITVASAVIGKIEKSLNGLLADSQLLLSEKIERVRQRIRFTRKHYKIAQNLDWLNAELDQLERRIVDQMNQQFSKIEIADSLKVPVTRIDEYDFFDSTEWLLETIRSGANS